MEVCQKINSGASIKMKDSAVEESVSSWLEEEQDMALKLSRELGVLVTSGHKKFKNDLNAKISFEKTKLVKERKLDSVISVDGAVSNITTIANFGRKNIEMSVDVNPTMDKTTRPKITWLRNQLKKCLSKNPDGNEQYQKNLMVDINIKFSSKPVRVMLNELEEAYEKLIGKEVKNFSVVYVNYLGRKFESRKTFVIQIEDMLVKYYDEIVQHLKNWEKPAYKMELAALFEHATPHCL